MKIQIENLKAQMQGFELNIHQRADALIEFNKLVEYAENLESEVENLRLFSVSHSALLDDLKVTNSLYEERQKLLDAIPECEEHGKCLPHALEWIDKAKSHCG